MFYVSIIFQKTCNLLSLEGGGPKNFLDILGGIRKENGNFQTFTPPTPLINNERSLRTQDQTHCFTGSLLSSTN